MIGSKGGKTRWGRRNLLSKEFHNLGTFHEKYIGNKQKAC